MSTIYPRSTALKKAIRWISEQRQEKPEQSINQLVNEAIYRFDLSPGAAEFLIKFYRGREGQ